MTPSYLIEYSAFMMENCFNLLVTGKPGIGKSDVFIQAFEFWQQKYNKKGSYRIWHPVISDPTDFKGLPYAKSNGATLAEFLPFEQLHEAMTATDDLFILIDDFGQAPPAVQAALMQPLLAREIGGKKISDKVRFIACTNRKEDKAAVTGLLEPVKSRFISIIELEVSVDDWVQWALNKGNMPIELIAFIRFRPALLDNFKPSKDIVNSPSPRTVASVGKQQNAGLPQKFEFEAFKGAAGEEFAIEYTAFLKMFRHMPSVDKIILDPTGSVVPTEPGILYGLSGALANKMNENNIDAILTYLDRLPAEMAVCCMKDAVAKKPDLHNTRSFTKWATGKVGNAYL